MKVVPFAVASVLLVVAGGLIYYDRLATEKREADTSGDRALAVEGVSFEDVRAFEFTTFSKSSEEGSEPESVVIKGAWSGDESSSLDEESKDEESKEENAEDEDPQEEGSWSLSHPLNFPANTEEVRNFIQGFLEYRYDELFQVEEARLASFGLATTDATNVLTLKTNQPELAEFSYRIGKDAPVGFKMYLAISTKPGQVFLGPRSSVITQQKKLEDFMDLSLAPISLEEDEILDLQVFLSKDSKTAERRFTFSLEGNRPDDSEEVYVVPPREEMKLSLISHSDLKERPSLVAVDDLIDDLSDVDAKKWVTLADLKEKILASSQRLVVSTRSKEEAEGESLEIFRLSGSDLQDQYYVAKSGEFFSVEKEGLGDYFSAKLDDFIEKLLPLDLKEESLSSLDITAYDSFTKTESSRKSYSLKQGLWSAEEPVKEESSSDVAEKEGVDPENPPDLPQEPEAVDEEVLRDDVTGFVAELLAARYVKLVLKKPEGDPALLYSVVLSSGDDSKTWEIYGSSGDPHIWFSLKGEEIYYLVRSSLLEELEPAREQGEVSGEGTELSDPFKSFEIKPQTDLSSPAADEEGAP